jgi:hypothetical protein
VLVGACPIPEREKRCVTLREEAGDIAPYRKRAEIERVLTERGEWDEYLELEADPTIPVAALHRILSKRPIGVDYTRNFVRYWADKARGA